MSQYALATPLPQHDAELDAFLARRFHTSMFLRAELLRTPERGHFMLARLDGRIVAAAAQVASGMVLLQTPVAAGEVARALLQASGRRPAGFFGSIAQVSAVRTALGLDAVSFAKDTREDLFSLELAEMVVPPALAAQQLGCRFAREGDAQLLVQWRAAFRVAVMKDAEGGQLEENCRAEIAALIASESLFVLEAGEPLACCSFNARLPQAVNIGNVWTPPALRGQGHGRAVVAGALQIARGLGVQTAVLATGLHNLPAQAAYRSIGFERVGDYATAVIGPDSSLPMI